MGEGPATFVKVPGVTSRYVLCTSEFRNFLRLCTFKFRGTYKVLQVKECWKLGFLICVAIVAIRLRAMTQIIPCTRGAGWIRDITVRIRIQGIASIESRMRSITLVFRLRNKIRAVFWYDVWKRTCFVIDWVRWHCNFSQNRPIAKTSIVIEKRVFKFRHPC